MKYIKLTFILLIIVYLFANSIDIYGTEKKEDLTLSRIYVEPGTLEPEFSETRDYYTLLLDPSITNLIVQATPTNKNLNYEIKGNENLKYGENIITITVYSSDNNQSKTYTINALKTNEPDKYNALLSTLIIDNYPFNEDFFPETFDYTVKKNTKENLVEVFAYPQNSNATTEIKGNTNLKDGDNEITVTVTSENGLAKRTYNIQLYKGDILSKSESTISKTNTIKNTDTSNFITFVITSVIILIALLSIILIIKNKS